MAKLLLLQLLLTFVVTVSGVTYKVPTDCSLPDCLYTADITMEPSGNISVVINAKQPKPDQTWTGIGFTKEKSMKKMSVVYGGSFKGKPIYMHGLWEPGKKLVPLPLLQSSLSQANGRLILTFTHPVNSSNPKDISFTANDCYYLVFLTENGKMSDEKGSVSIEASKKIVSDKQMCVKELKTTGPTTHTPTPGGDDTIMKSKGKEVYPPNCEQQPPCVTTVTWNLNPTKKVVKFQLVARQDKNTYTGVGFALSGKGKGPLIAVLGYKNKAGKDVITTATLSKELDITISNSGVLQSPKLEYSQGEWKLDFELKLNAGSKDEIDLTKNSYYLVLFPEGGKISIDNKLGKPIKEPGYSLKKIHFLPKDDTPEFNDGDLVAHHMWKYNCKNDNKNCQYKASWVPRQDVVEFTITARLINKNKFTGIGLAKKHDLSFVDFIYVKKLDDFDDPEFHHGLMKNSGTPVDYPGTDKALVSYKSSVDGDRVVMTFTHNREPLDENDISLAPNQCYYLVFPYEGGDLKAEDPDEVKLTKYHITKDKICFNKTKSEVFLPNIFVPEPVIQTPPITNKRICYFANWAPDISEPTRFLPKHIDPFLCSHIVYSFAWVKDGRVVPSLPTDIDDKGKKGRMRQINDLKLINRNLKTLLSIGGDGMDIGEMTEMLVDEEYRRSFILSVTRFLRKYGFDGVNLMFKYPGYGKSPPEDKDRFMSLIREMKAAFRREIIGTTKPRLILSVSVSVLPEVMEKSYYVKELSTEVDCIELMTFDLHGAWENVARHHSSLHPGETGDTLSVESVVQHWIDLGAAPEKLVVGIGLYGHGGVLEDIDADGLGSALTKPSPPGQYTKTEGLLAYYEICMLLKEPDTEQHWLYDQAVPYLIYRPKGIWMGYDNEKSVYEKAVWLKEEGLGGYFVWITHFDDFKGTFCNNRPYPLIRTLSETLVGKIPHVMNAHPIGGFTTPETTGSDIPENTETVTMESNTATHETQETQESIGTSTTISSTKDKCANQPNGKMLPMQGRQNCNKFIQCTNHVSKNMKCAGVQFFDIKASKCVQKELLTPERKRECGL